MILKPKLLIMPRQKTQEEFLIDLRKWIAKLKYLKINQREVANYIGISESTLSAWANGKTPISKHLERVLERLDEAEKNKEDLRKLIPAFAKPKNK